MYGHPRHPTEQRGGSRILEKRIQDYLGGFPLARTLKAYGELGRRRGQRVLLHGSLLREIALGGNPSPQDSLDLAVSGDALSYAMALAESGGGRWWPSVQGRETALVSQGGRTLAISLLRGGVLPYLASMDFTVDGLGIDLSEPGGILDAWGGLEDASKRRLVPSGDLAPDAHPGRLLRGLAMELEWGLDPSPRLGAAYPRLQDPDFMQALRPTVFWDLLDPFLAAGRADHFRDGRLGGVFSAFLAAQGGPLSDPMSEDLPLLQELDRIEAGLAAAQIQERGQRLGAGLSSAARLGALLWLRSPEDPGKVLDRPESLGRGPGLARTLREVLRGARGLLDRGFPYKIPPPIFTPGPTQAAAALLAAAMAAVEPRPQDCSRPPCEPVRALRVLLGIRVPRVA